MCSLTPFPLTYLWKLWKNKIMIKKTITWLFLLVLQISVSGQPLPKHGLHYETPALVWDEALPLGNGLLGALVWGDGKPIKVSLDRTDLWDLRPVPEFYTEDYKYRVMRQWVKEKCLSELQRKYEEPYHNPGPTKIPAGRIELNLAGQPVFVRADLDIATASASLKFDNETIVRVFIHAREPVGLIQIYKAEAVSPKLVVPPFGGPVKSSGAKSAIGMELGLLGYAPPQRASGENWTAYSQKGWQDSSFAVVLMWKRTGQTWLASWSIATNKEGANPVEVAKKRCRKALAAGFEKLFEEHKAWWISFWNKSSIRIPNETLERQWYLEMYKFGSAARIDAPPIALQGPWTADDGLIPPWKGDYHHDLNTELSYWPAYTGNHLEGEEGYINWLWKTMANAREWTNRFFELPGLNVPMTADLNQQQIGGWHQYTHSATTAGWLAHHFYLHWRYTMNEDFLREKAYPWLKETAIFLEAVTEKEPNGKRLLPLSSSPEINDNRLEAWFPSITNYDLALIRFTFEKSTELAEILGKEDEAAHWRSLLSEMPDFSLDPQLKCLLVAKNYPLPFSHRHFSHLMAIHPLGLIQWEKGAEHREIIKSSMSELEKLGTEWWTGYSFSWLASLAARGRDGQKAEKALEIFATAFCLRNSFHCNGDQSGKGYSKFSYRPFTLEGNFAAAAGLNEMLLQSYSGTIRIFPAIPDGWKDVAFKTLRAEGAFLISAERKAGLVEKIEIISEKGGMCKIENPFIGADYRFEGARAEDIASVGDEITIKTSPGQKVALCRTRTE